MKGVVRKRDVLSHPAVTIRGFGWRVFIKALLAGRNRTLLSVVAECQVVEARKSQSQAQDPLHLCRAPDGGLQNDPRSLAPPGRKVPAEEEARAATESSPKGTCPLGHGLR